MADLPEQLDLTEQPNGSENAPVNCREQDLAGAANEPQFGREPLSQDADNEKSNPVKENGQLFPSEQGTRLDREWQAIQVDFVDSPRASVEKADALVTRTIDALATSFAEMRNSLERAWEKDEEVSTEDLRLALQNYRSFFRRLLSI